MSKAPEGAPSTVILVIAAGRRLQAQMEDRLVGIGLSVRLFSALGHLSRDADLSYSDLARRAGVTSQSMRATVLLLEEMGAVERNLQGQGHRARLELTDEGRALLARARGLVSELDAEFLAEADEELKGALEEACRLVLGGSFPARPR
ncbi:MarR family winged helix-turn-helix transcriptional regulator [Streptomyces benahoarensis]|uniref:MarR family transcriptional regulator n=1 Tax=Streptomyces benahoarensis TaxID=2595054 RepID=A0A553YRN8_9ACTN|nr:MarR family transcriptional regulator [Streptomyces benahoarensis]TSB31859.1 MarR family transcriptional regulator [Streptomyces benahoarensis]